MNTPYTIVIPSLCALQRILSFAISLRKYTRLAIFHFHPQNGFRDHTPNSTMIPSIRALKHAIPFKNFIPKD